jgi:hypothetical protein
VGHEILTSLAISTRKLQVCMDIRHHTCTYQGCTNIISVNAPCTIFHVVYSINISSLFLVCIFPIGARATLMKNRPITTATIQLKSSKKTGKKIKRKKRPSLQIILHVVMSRSCRLEAWKELHMYPLKTNPLSLILFFFPRKNSVEHC